MAKIYIEKDLENIAECFINDMKGIIDIRCEQWSIANNRIIIPLLSGNVTRYSCMSREESYKWVDRIDRIGKLDLSYENKLTLADMIRNKSYMISQHAFNRLKETIKRFHNIDIDKR